MKTKKRISVRIAGSLAILLMIVSLPGLMEYVSGRILISRGLLSKHHRLNDESFRSTINFWMVSQNTPNFTFQGINQEFQAGEMTELDENGFITGDSIPLAKQKPKNTTRVFIVGGSTAFGCLQTASVIKDSSYPVGIYDYPTSIAGYLRKILEERYPDRHFEVVNASVSQHRFNQHLAMYFERIREFSPDIIINIDGYNDMGIPLDFYYKGDPYKEGMEGQIREAFNLELLRRSAKFGKTLLLLNSFTLDQAFSQDEFPLGEILHRAGEVISVEDIQRCISTWDEYKKFHVDDFPKTAFGSIDTVLKQNLQKQFGLIDAYMYQLKRDGTYGIFCYQPVLEKGGKQKKLSALERYLLEQVRASNWEGGILTDSFLLTVGGFDPKFIQALTKIGNAKYVINEYYLKYFIDDYLLPEIGSIVRSGGGAFIDVNEKIVGMSDSLEFYVDYCHLTPYGNQFIAELLAREVECFLE